jgi:hypothetical protein
VALRRLRRAGPRVSPPGPIRIASPGRRGASGFGPTVGYAGFSSVLGRSHPNGTPLSSGEPEGRSRWQTSREPAGSRGPAGPIVRQSPGAPGGSVLRDGSSKAQEGTGREADPTAIGSVLWRGAAKPMRASARRTSVRAGTDPRGEQCPGAAGHRDLLVLRAEERDVRNGKRATAPKGVRLCEGETL